MKKIYFIIIALFFATYSYGQKNDYVTILKRLPPVADNVLATEKEKEMYREKLCNIRAALSEYQSKFQNIGERKQTPSEYNSLEYVLQEYESINEKHINKFLENMLGKWSDIYNNNMVLMADLDKANQPYYEQIRALISKPKSAENDKLIRNLRRKIYDSKLQLYPTLQNKSNDFLKQSYAELNSITLYVNKLDSMLLHVIKQPSAGVGPILLDNYVGILDETFFLYHLGSFEEYLKDDWNLDYLFIGLPI